MNGEYGSIRRIAFFASTLCFNFNLSQKRNVYRSWTGTFCQKVVLLEKSAKLTMWKKTWAASKSARLLEMELFYRKWKFLMKVRHFRLFTKLCIPFSPFYAWQKFRSRIWKNGKLLCERMEKQVDKIKLSRQTSKWF